MTYAENILRVWEQATDSEIFEGMEWYPKVHLMARDLADGDVWRGAGVMAAFSPMLHWDKTVQYASESLRTGIAYPAYLGDMVWQAQRILDGEHPLDVLGGQKVRAFATAIATAGESEPAVIDTHAHNIAVGRVVSSPSIGKRLFRTMAEHYRQAALDVGVRTSDMQATTWVVWRNRYGKAA
jgi:hypothetical protein